MDKPFGVFSSHEREMREPVLVLTISAAILADGAIAASAHVPRHSLLAARGIEDRWAAA
jgi:hypothetical protein